MYFGKAGASISPSSGDGRETSWIITMEENDAREGLEVETGLSRLLRGTSKYFIVLVADAGFTFYPKNMKRSNDSLYKLEDFCKDVGCVLLSPPNDESKEVLQLGNYLYSVLSCNNQLTFKLE